MLRWSALFLVIALIAGMLGYTNIAGSALGIAQVLFFLFLIPGVILLIMGAFFIARKG